MKKIAIIGSNTSVLNFMQTLIYKKGLSLRNVVMSTESLDTNENHHIIGVKVVTCNAVALRNAHIVIFADGKFDFNKIIEILSPEKQIIIDMSSNNEPYQFFNISKAKYCFNFVTSDDFILGKSILFASTSCRDKYILKQIEELFNIFGEILYVDDNLIENAFLLKNCTNLFLMRFIHSSCNAAVNFGMDSKTSFYIITRGLAESLITLEQEKTTTETEIDKLISGKNYLVEGLNELEEHGFSFALQKGIGAAKKKLRISTLD